jgi:tetratricopeptide (TPR) repeat protein
LFLAACLLGVATLSHADPVTDAKAHFERATSLFATAHFEEAAREYEAAYMAKPDSAFLYDAAQCYRHAGKTEKAIALYENFISFYPNDGHVPAVREHIAKLKQQEREKADQATRADQARKQPALEMMPAPQIVVVSTPTPAKTPVYKKWWLWTIVGVVVVGGAVTAGVLATRSSWSNVADFGPGSSSGLRIP